MFRYIAGLFLLAKISSAYTDIPCEWKSLTKATFGKKTTFSCLDFY